MPRRPMHRSSLVLRAALLETVEPRRLLATLSGSVFYDDDLDGNLDPGENNLPGWTIWADTNNNGSFDGANATYTSADVPLAINDNSTIVSSLPITGVGGTVAGVRVTIDITHTYVDDLDIFLISPAGTRIELTTDNGGFGGNDFTGTTFDDDAPTSITTIGSGGAYTGSYRPEGTLSSLAGQPIDGNWRLEVTDDASIDVGTLNAWSINLRSGEPSVTTTAAGFILSGAPAGQYNVYLDPQPGYQNHRTSALARVSTASSVVSGLTFGVRLPPGSITGSVYNDFNRDGIRDPDETGIAGRTVYIDLDNDSQLDANEPSVTTDASGVYTFSNLRPGQRFVRTVLPNKWFQTSPASGALVGVSTVTAATGSAANSLTPAKNDYLAEQMILSVNSRSRLDAALAKSANRNLRAAALMSSAATLGKVSGGSILFVKLRAGMDAAKLAHAFGSLAGVNWAQPNYIYERAADPREYTPSDPAFGSQYHHTRMQNPAAWDISEGAGVKIGITDDGFQLNHPDLAANIFTNPGEIAGNGIDDDANGYVDDVNGWDFTNSTTTGTGDNNPSPVTSSDDHGTHVAGIAAGRTDNGVGIAGTAGKAKIVPLRFYGSGSWTSTVIWNTYKYAADNGIKVLSTSYNVDGFSNDNLFLQALNYIYDNGVLHFNSAGNSGALNPVRQKWDQSLYVAATTPTDTKAGFSNYGTGIDISAPGDDIYSTVTNSGYATYGGTSMATPNAAGVAALIWAANPTWTREQVAAQLLGTADNIYGIAGNASFANLLGTGRVNSLRAVSQALGAPRLRGVLNLPAEGGTSITSPTQIRVQFFNLLDPASANNLANWTLTGAGTDDIFGTSDDFAVPLSLTGDSSVYRIGTNEFLFNIGSTLTTGTYRFSASNLVDPFGNALDGNNDGAGGDAFTRTFFIAGITVARNITLAAGEDRTLADFGMRETTAPTVASSLFEFETGLALRYVFSEDMTAPTAASISIQNTTTAQTLTPDQYVVTFDQVTRTARVELSPTIASGNFVATLLSDHTTDRFGNQLDGDANGSGGGSHSFAFSFVHGDANRDGTVNFDDLLIVAQNFEQTGRTFTFSQGNVNFDAAGEVNFDDLLIIAQNFSFTLVRPSATTRRGSRVPAGLV